MKYNIGKNWLSTSELMAKHSIVILPFIFIAFLETLALELIYFSPRRPISFITNPIIRKFFGEMPLHYPGNLVILPRLFYYAQVSLYVAFGVFLTAISVNIFKNIKAGLPVKLKALVKNALKSYLSFFVYAVMVIIIVTLLRNANMFVFSKAIRLILRYFPNFSPQIYQLCVVIFVFLMNVILQALLILVIPLIVIEKSSLLKALLRSAYLGIRNFFTIFTLIFVPFLIYLPLTILKSFSTGLVNRTFPEINLYVTIAGIIISAFLDCFVIICASQFLLDREQ